ARQTPSFSEGQERTLRSEVLRSTTMFFNALPDRPAPNVVWTILMAGTLPSPSEREKTRQQLESRRAA
ncbi:hypothetical protein, partial [Roseibium sp. RKSG952]|uniref:hypothetical protein n=1 Tax=Roseibium sp. RKSG952 TaxID=2529384 RepID=UPI001AD90C92